jgi:predicted membrane channel-forming protein YqfA (hemolysin III family)
MKSWGWLLIGAVWLIAVASRILTLPGRERLINFGKRVSMVLVFAALLALTPLVALLSFYSDGAGDVLFGCKDWVKACWRGISDYSSA